MGWCREVGCAGAWNPCGAEWGLVRSERTPQSWSHTEIQYRTPTRPDIKYHTEIVRFSDSTRTAARGGGERAPLSPLFYTTYDNTRVERGPQARARRGRPRAATDYREPATVWRGMGKPLYAPIHTSLSCPLLSLSHCTRSPPSHSKQSSGWSTHHSAGTRAAKQLRASGRSTKSELASAVGSGIAGHAARWRSVACRS